MPLPVTVPRLGWSMEEGTFGQWLKRDGETVRPGDPLFVLEGEKAAQDIESLDAGILRISPDGPQPGQIVKVGEILAYLVQSGELAPFEGGMTNDEGPMTKVGRERSKETSVVLMRGDTPHGSAFVSPEPQDLSTRKSAAPRDVTSAAASPSVRRLARERGIDLTQLAGSGAGGRITVDDVAAASSRHQPQPSRHGATEKEAPTSSRLRISPRARRAAREHGVDAAAIIGSGRNGRIRERDVLQFASRATQTTVQSTAKSPSTSSPPVVAGELMPLTPIRRTIAKRMVAGVQQAAPVTLHTQIDATGLVQLRQQFRAAAERAGADSLAANDAIIPSFTDLIVKLTAVALEQHRECLLQWRDDGLLRPEGLHIAVAVDTAAGLLAPVLRDVDQLTLRQVASQLADLTDEARAGRLRMDELQGGVFTVTNLGMYGIDQFTPILNLPQSGILGVGRIRQEPAVVGDKIVPRSVMALSLTFDHRAVDGAPAARFLQSLSRCLEQPGVWLMT